MIIAQKTTERSICRAATSLAALAIASLSTPVQAQNAVAQATSTDDTIVVTGTRRTDRTVLESAAPVDVFSADDFKAQPAPQLQTILQTLVPSFNQQRNLLGDASAFVRPPTLRGLPSDQILVLINNKRMHRSALVQVAAGSLNAGAQGADLSALDAYGESPTSAVVNGSLVLVTVAESPPSATLTFDSEMGPPAAGRVATNQSLPLFA
jgi:iron complex outermembrane receptor protein